MPICAIVSPSTRTSPRYEPSAVTMVPLAIRVRIVPPRARVPAGPVRAGSLDVADIVARRVRPVSPVPAGSLQPLRNGARWPGGRGGRGSGRRQAIRGADRPVSRGAGSPGSRLPRRGPAGWTRRTRTHRRQRPRRRTPPCSSSGGVDARGARRLHRPPTTDHDGGTGTATCRAAPPAPPVSPRGRPGSRVTNVPGPLPARPRTAPIDAPRAGPRDRGAAPHRRQDSRRSMSASVGGWTAVASSSAACSAASRVGASPWASTTPWGEVTHQCQCGGAPSWTTTRSRPCRCVANGGSSYAGAGGDSAAAFAEPTRAASAVDRLGSLRLLRLLRCDGGAVPVAKEHRRTTHTPTVAPSGVDGEGPSS